MNQNGQHVQDPVAPASGIKFEPALRARMETAFDADFSQVRLSVDGLPSIFGAHALTRGNQIHFLPYAWAPDTRAGLDRPAHELTHVVQQARGCIPGSVDSGELWLNPVLEAQADHVASMIIAGRDRHVAGFLAARKRSPVCPGAPRFAWQPQLVVENTGNLVLLATNALSLLTGAAPNALVYAAIPEGISVSPGIGFAAAQGLRPRACAVLGRVMASAHWTTIRPGGNGITPSMWSKDKAWAAVRGVKGFMTKVTTPGRGASSTITWDGGVQECADFDALLGHIVMENVPSHIMLAHELIHADRIGRGTFKNGGSSTAFVIDTAHPPPYQRYSDRGWRWDPNAATWVGLLGGAWVANDQVAIDDIANCGFHDTNGSIGVDPLLVTENMIRADFNINLRSKYGSFRTVL